MQPPINRDQSPEKVAARMRAAIQMHESGLRMLKARLRREHPQETASQIQNRVADYLRADRGRGQHDIQPTLCPRFSATS